MPLPCAGFTQGLEWYGDLLYESCGQYQQSSLRLVNATSGRVLQRVAIEGRFFAEGLTVWGSELFVLTWREHVVLVYSLDLRLLRTVPFPYEGWGLTHSPTHLILSNGSSHLTYLDPATLTPTHTVSVTALHPTSNERRAVPMLNELEWVGGLVYANVWMDTEVVVVDEGGRVVRRLSVAAVWKDAGGDERNKVVNGIAWKEDEGKLVVTGKSAAAPRTASHTAGRIGVTSFRAVLTSHLFPCVRRVWCAGTGRLCTRWW